MRRLPWVSLVPLLAAGGCTSATISGVLTDGLLKKPIAEQRIIAKASSDSASLSCMAFEATTDAEGKFSMQGVCTGSAYVLSFEDDTLWVPGLEPVPDGGAEGLALEAWRARPADGLAEITTEGFDRLRTHADVKVMTIKGSEETVRFPWSSIPGGLPVIEKGEYLVLSGKKTVSTFEVVPLLRSQGVRFPEGNDWFVMDPWYYIGTTFQSDTEFQRVKAELDESKVVTKETDDQAAKYIPGDAVPAGRYAILAPDSEVVTIVDFGEPFKKPAPAE